MAWIRHTRLSERRLSSDVFSYGSNRKMALRATQSATGIFSRRSQRKGGDIIAAAKWKRSTPPAGRWIFRLNDDNSVVICKSDGGRCRYILYPYKEKAWTKQTASKPEANSLVVCRYTSEYCQCIEYDGGRLPYCTDAWFQLPVTPGIHWADKVIVGPEEAEEQMVYGNWKQESILRDA